ncbi:MAG: translation elongation factor Ts [Oscillospiraceae bacterium]|jgi:elongation factor Ts|nr:translation elongation factor Ts [Oscillospiraceae bacterium]MCI1990397.1 translation elongation factor Ts [Oscillospiraceae bacterium]MCI2035949.1 translation elongation factor Ts [Oscillospiraceae bacterium]
MAFTAKDVAALRAKTGCGMMDCKKALSQADGDMDKAVDFLREKGLAAATKKAGRIAAEGIAYAEVNGAADAGVVIEVNAETDFVAKNAEFRNFVKTCADTVLASDPADVAALLHANAAGSDETIDAILKEKILKIGENIKIRRFKKFDGVVGAYIHADGKIGVLAKFDTTPEIAAKPEFKEYAKDVCMQIAAIVPQYVDEAGVPADVVDHEKGILKQQVIDSGKPAAIADKIVQGRLRKFFEQVCLVDQAYIRDDKLTIRQLTEQTGKKLGGAIRIVDFARFERGEGLEKRQDNFAEEIKSLVH